jgi:hypothetical protein
MRRLSLTPAPHIRPKEVCHCSHLGEESYVCLTPFFCVYFLLKSDFWSRQISLINFRANFCYLRSSLVQINYFQNNLLILLRFPYTLPADFFDFHYLHIFMHYKYRVKRPYWWNVGCLRGFPCYSRNHVNLLQSKSNQRDESGIFRKKIIKTHRL